MKRIFISYKRADKEKVFAIKDKIEAATGEKCWIDLDGIESDAQFANVIIRAVDEADIFLFMYSKCHSKIKDFERDWTVRELGYAEDEGKRIVFINIDHTPLTKWFKLMFKYKQQVDATSEEAMFHLLADLNKWLGKEASLNDIRMSLQNNSRKTTKHLIWVTSALVALVLSVGIFILTITSKQNPNDTLINGEVSEFIDSSYTNNHLAKEEASASIALKGNALHDTITTTETIKRSKSTPSTNKKSTIVETVTIDKSTTIARLARQYYNNTNCWVYIYMANKDKITTPNNLPIGKELIIPELNEEEQKISKEESLKLYNSFRHSTNQ